MIQTDNPIRIDVHEPATIAGLLGHTHVVKYPASLNPDLADYVWEDCEGVQVEWERKTWAELAGGLDSVEEQLRRENQRNKGNRLGLIIEGVATPSMSGMQMWKRSAKGDVFYKTREMFRHLKAVYAWLHQVERFMEVHYTSGPEATAIALSAFYDGDQKKEHTTFQRHLHTMDWHPNPQVMMLMAMGSGIGIGPAKAELLVRKYGTIWNILNKTPGELSGAGLGPATTTKLLRKVGRPDV